MNATLYSIRIRIFELRHIECHIFTMKWPGWIFWCRFLYLSLFLSLSLYISVSVTLSLLLYLSLSLRMSIALLHSRLQFESLGSIVTFIQIFNINFETELDDNECDQRPSDTYAIGYIDERSNIWKWNVENGICFNNYIMLSKSNSVNFVLYLVSVAMAIIFSPSILFTSFHLSLQWNHVHIDYASYSQQKHTHTPTQRDQYWFSSKYH